MDNKDFNFDQNTTTEAPGAEKTAPWFLQRDTVVPDESYNPYRDPSTVLADALKENREILRGPKPLEREARTDYDIRMAFECAVLKSSVYKKLRKDAAFIALLLFSALAMTFFFSIAIADLCSFVSPDTAVIISYISVVLQYLFLFPPIIYLANLGRKNKLRTYFKKPRVSAFFIARWAVIAFGASYIANFVTTVIFAMIESYGVYVNDLTAPLPTGFAELVIYFIGVVICAPIIEELLFRGVLLTPLMKYGAWFAAFTTGILFGAFHQNHQQFLYTTVFGIILAFINIKAASIVPSIIIHVSLNLFSFISTLTLTFTNYNEILFDPTLKLDGPVFALYMHTLFNVIIYASMIIAIIGFIIEVTKNKDQFKIKENSCGLSSGEKLSGMFASPAMIGVIIVLVLFIMMNSFIDYGALMEMLNQ